VFLCIGRMPTGLGRTGSALIPLGVADEFATRRRQFKRAKLFWRVSSGPRRSLGWIPFKASALQYKGGQVHLAGVPLPLWDSYGLSRYELGGGGLSEDARGQQRPGSGDSRQDFQPAQGPPAQSLHAPSGHPPGHLCGR